MPSLEESVARVTDFYSNHASYFHESAYASGRSEAKHARLRAFYKEALRGHVVLEIAAGSGYWTDAVANTAQRVVATDVHANLVDVIRQRLKHLTNVQCQVADAYSLTGVAEDFTAAFAQYWWSHVPRKRLKDFLDTLHSKLRPGALVIFSDDLMYDGENVTRRMDENGDMQETLTSKHASVGERIKNFPTEQEFDALLVDTAEDIQYREYEPEHLWSLSYRLRG